MYEWTSNQLSRLSLFEPNFSGLVEILISPKALVMKYLVCMLIWSKRVLDRVCKSWWRHQIEIFSALLAFCTGNSSVTGEFPSQRLVTRSFDVFFDLRLNNPVNNREAGVLRRHRAHYDVTVMWTRNQLSSPALFERHFSCLWTLLCPKRVLWNIEGVCQFGWIYFMWFSYFFVQGITNWTADVHSWKWW